MIHYIIVKWNSDADKKSLSENARALYDALAVWDKSDLHLKWKSDFGGFIEKKCIFDCEE